MASGRKPLHEDQLGALGLLLNVLVLWATGYMDLALATLRAQGHDVKEEDVARLSPLGYSHVNLLRRYDYALPEAVARGAYRPLRDPSRETEPAPAPDRDPDAATGAAPA